MLWALIPVILQVFTSAKSSLSESVSVLYIFGLKSECINEKFSLFLGWFCRKTAYDFFLLYIDSCFSYFACPSVCILVCTLQGV